MLSVKVSGRACSACTARPFWLSGQVAHDDFYLVKLAHLHGDVRKRAQQTAFAVADNALYQNPFFLQRSDRLRVECVGFPLNCHNCQGALAAGDEVHGCLWQRAFDPCSGFDEVAMDRFDAASVLRGKLGGALLAFAVALLKGVGI